MRPIIARETSLSHVWTAPSWQGLSSRRLRSNGEWSPVCYGALDPPVGGLFGFKFSSRSHPRKFGQKRFLALRRSWRGNGVAFFWLPPWEKFSAA
jgi:hypothetical protein